MSTKEKQQTSGASIVIGCILVIAIVGLVIGTIILFSSINEYSTAAAVYDNLAENYVAPVSNDTAQPSLQDVALQGQLRYDIDFDSLRKINPDVIGWIIIENTPVNYPILKSKDNAEYLNLTFDGKKNACGSIFIDYENRPDFSDRNTIIYGHNMKNGSMFKTVNYFSDEKYYQEHKDGIWICTPYWQRKYSVISAHATSSTASTYSILFDSDEAYMEHLVSEVSASWYVPERTYDVSKNLVTLSTCRGSNSNQRFVLLLQADYEISVK